MEFLYDEKPIVACSTGCAQASALAVIRFSGFKSLEIFKDFFSTSLSKFSPRKAVFTQIFFQGKIFDEAVGTFFPSPQSYTGENIFELSVHGNPLRVSKLLEMFTSQGHFRLAREGEFTYRALKNQKMTLSQVEGLELLLNANSSEIFDEGLSLLNGELQKEYLDLYNLYLKVRASLELSIDFLEDAGEENAKREFELSFEKFSFHVESLHRRSQAQNADLLAPSVIFLGQTNAGKSSLFNAFLKSKRSIVSPTAGTTRDFISEYFVLKEVNYKLLDTAGLRQTSDAIESEGIQRALKLFHDSFFRILVVNPLETNLSDFAPLFESFSQQDLDAIVVTHAGKKDFSFSWGKIESYFDCRVPLFKLELGSIEPKLLVGSIEPIFELISKKYTEATQRKPFLVARHRAAINKIQLNIEEFKELYEKTNDIAVLCNKINIIGSLLEELIGYVSPNDVLNSLFDRFCIGK